MVLLIAGQEVAGNRHFVPIALVPDHPIDKEALLMNRRDILRFSALIGGIGSGRRSKGAAAATEAAPPLDNPFLQGNFAPVREEVIDDNLRIIGQLPPEMNGMFVRNGPNPQFPPLGHYHWFDGDGMLHGVRVRDGKASYRNSYVRTEGWKEEHQAGKAIYRGLIDPPDLKRVVKGVFTGKAPFKNTANTSVIWHDGRLLALWEAGPPHAIRLPELETIGVHTFGGKLKHPFTAHPKVDPVTGELLCFGYNLAAKPYLQYSVISPRGEILSTTPIDLPRPIMMHDFAVTTHYSIFMDLPETFDLKRAMQGKAPFDFEPELGARFGILPRHGKGSAIQWFSSAACFVFHTLNAYEEGDEVVLLACRFQEFPANLSFQAGNTPQVVQDRNRFKPVLYRWRFNLKTGTVKEGPLDDEATEFPRVPDSLLGKSSRYGYCARVSEAAVSDGLVKYDLVKGTSEHHLYGQGRSGGEGVFVPRPDAQAEDDGWLVSYVYDQTEDKSEMVVIDARDFQSPPVARILLPRRVPYGFHGTWITDQQLVVASGE